jgi:hypothetical protein
MIVDNILAFYGKSLEHNKKEIKNEYMLLKSRNDTIYKYMHKHYGGSEMEQKIEKINKIYENIDNDKLNDKYNDLINKITNFYGNINKFKIYNYDEHLKNINFAQINKYMIEIQNNVDNGNDIKIDKILNMLHIENNNDKQKNTKEYSHIITEYRQIISKMYNIMNDNNNKNTDNEIIQLIDNNIGKIKQLNINIEKDILNIENMKNNIDKYDNEYDFSNIKKYVVEKNIKNDLYDDVSKYYNGLNVKYIKENDIKLIKSIIEKLTINNKNAFLNIENKIIDDKHMDIIKKFIYDFNYNMDNIGKPEYKLFNINDVTEKINNAYFNKMQKKNDINHDHIIDILGQKIDNKTLLNPNFNNLKGGTVSLQDKINEYMTIGNMIINKYNIYIKLLEIYNKSYYDNVYYTIFMITATTNSFYLDNYYVYKYINKSILYTYKNALDDIINKIDNKYNISNGVSYIRKYYYIIIKKLHNFINNITKHLKPTQFIKIDAIDNNDDDVLVFNFLLFNNFFGIIDSYREHNIGKITLYSRINNFENNITQFLSSVNNNTMEIIYDDSICKKITNNQFNKEKVNFDFVFDSVNFPHAENIAIGMLIHNQLKNGKGVALLTYGYSGTGKTYTLFGKTEKMEDNKINSIPGLLQSTLHKLNDLSKVYFRVFELYGIGVPYGFYWPEGTDLSKLNHMIYEYILSKNNNNELDIEEVKKIQNNNDDIKEFTNINNNYDSKYITIESKEVKDVFNNFENMMIKIDDIRKGNIDNNKLYDGTKRIKTTPNNKESSRSILIYDFVLKIVNRNKKNEFDYVNFLIIDLPGKENLNKSYIEPYYDNIIIKSINNSQNLKLHKMLLTSLILNPFGICLLYPDDIINFVNNNTDIIDILINNNILDSVINKHNFKLSYKNIVNIQNKKIIIKNQSDYNVFVNSNSYKQIQSLTCIFIIYILINNHKHDELIYIYEYIANIHINLKIIKYLIITYTKLKINMNMNYNTAVYTLQNNIKNNIQNNIRNNITSEIDILISQNFKVNQLSDFKKNIKANNNNDILFEYFKILKYDYHKCAMEGIYINEMIIGLLKYLKDNVMSTEYNTFDIKNQDIKNSNFNYQMIYNRILNMNSGIPCKAIDNIVLDEKIENIFNYDDIVEIGARPIYCSNSNDLQYNYSVIDNEISNDTIMKKYDSSKTYCPNYPIISTILNPYLEKISEFKIFYLFSNKDTTDHNINCVEQINLLSETYDFIENIVNQKN